MQMKFCSLLPTELSIIFLIWHRSSSLDKPLSLIYPLLLCFLFCPRNSKLIYFFHTDCLRLCFCSYSSLCFSCSLSLIISGYFLIFSIALIHPGRSFLKSIGSVMCPLLRISGRFFFFFFSLGDLSCT